MAISTPASRPAAPAEAAPLRTFIACPLPPAVRLALGQAITVLRAVWPPGAMRWVVPGNMHMTLRFLGDTPSDRVAALEAGLAEVAAACEPLEVRLGGLGGFPAGRRPQVLWVGVEGDIAALKRLQLAVEEMVGGLGWAAEGRPFRPHLTLGRVRGKRRLAAGEGLPAVPPVDFRLDAVELLQSRLRPEGAVYTSLCRVGLG